MVPQRRMERRICARAPVALCILLVLTHNHGTVTAEADAGGGSTNSSTTVPPPCGVRPMSDQMVDCMLQKGCNASTDCHLNVSKAFGYAAMPWTHLMPSYKLSFSLILRGETAESFATKRAAFVDALAATLGVNAGAHVDKRLLDDIS